VMRRVVLFLSAGVIGAVLAYCIFYFCGTHRERHLMESEQPELTWLKDEFRLSDADFKRVSELHGEYLKDCEQMCQRIASKNAELKELLARTNAVTPDIEKNLTEAAQLRAQCQRNMLQHFMEVSRQMPPEQGRRYLAWVQERTLGGKGDMMSEHH
jgi:Zn-finger protein